MFFSIVIPTFNRETTIIRAINSILSQSFTDYEIVVVDDGSTDQTEKVIQLIDSKKIRYFKTVNYGVAHARNYGILKAQGKYIGFLDSDDFMEIVHLQTAYEFIKNSSEPEIIHLNFNWGAIDRLNSQKNLLPVNLPDDIFTSCSLHVNCIFIITEIAKANLFNENRDLMFAEDWEFFIRLAVKYQIHLLDRTTVYLVDHSDRSMRNFNEEIWVKKRDAIVRSLASDTVVLTKYHHKIKCISAHMNSLIALNLALQKKRVSALKYMLLSIRQNSLELLTKRTAAVIKHILLPRM